MKMEKQSRKMLLAKIKWLEIEVEKWKEEFRIEQEMHMMLKVVQDYTKTKEFEKVKETEE